MPRENTTESLPFSDDGPGVPRGCGAVPVIERIGAYQVMGEIGRGGWAWSITPDRRTRPATWR